VPADEAPVASDGALAGVDHVAAAELARAADALARGPTTARTVRAHDALRYVQARRAASGVPEVHDAWVDVTFVQAGRGSALTGGRVVGARVTSPGEHRGGRIEGGATQPLGPGDLLVIPAGVPHQYLLASGDTLRYLTVKVRASR
jgi:uncharacterized RmlC-like cupin family protein